MTVAHPRPHGRGHFWLLAASLVPVLVFAAFATVLAIGSYRDVQDERLREVAQAMAAAVDAKLEAYVTALRALALSPLLDPGGELAALEERAGPVAAMLGGWVVVIEGGPDHPIVLNTAPRPGTALPMPLPAELLGGWERMLGAVFRDGEPFVSDLFQGPVTGRPVVTALVPVARGGRVVRGLGLGFPPAALLPILAAQELPPEAFVAVADGGLRILAHSLDPDGRRTGMAAPDWVPAAIAGKRRTLVVGPGWSGQDNVYAVERLRMAPGWTITVAQPLAGLAGAARSAFLWLLAGMGATIAWMAVAILYWRRAAVAESRREAAALRAGRAEVERLLGGLPAVIFHLLVRAEGPYVTRYRAGDIGRVTGWPSAALAEGEAWHRRLGPDAADFGAFVDRACVGGRATAEFAVPEPAGAVRFLRVSALSLGAAEGGTELVGYISDVTAERLADARAAAAGRLAAMGEMAAGLAHELKQSLQAIMMAATNARAAVGRGDTAKAEGRLERIQAQVRRTAELIENLRRFARGHDAGAPPERIAIPDVVGAVCGILAAAMRDGGIAVEEAYGDPVPEALVHRVALEQVLVNLLLNARDAMAAQPPDRPRRIRIEADRLPDGRCRITVADTGGGIPPAILPRLFQPFTTSKGPDKGTGLGLSICHGMLGAMGGSIAAANDAEGAVFTILLPAPPAA